MSEQDYGNLVKESIAAGGHQTGAQREECAPSTARLDIAEPVFFIHSHARAPLMQVKAHPRHLVSLLINANAGNQRRVAMTKLPYLPTMFATCMLFQVIFV